MSTANETESEAEIAEGIYEFHWIISLRYIWWKGGLDGCSSYSTSNSYSNLSFRDKFVRKGNRELVMISSNDLQSSSEKKISVMRSGLITSKLILITISWIEHWPVILLKILKILVARIS